MSHQTSASSGAAFGSFKRLGLGSVALAAALLTASPGAANPGSGKGPQDTGRKPAENEASKFIGSLIGSLAPANAPTKWEEEQVKKLEDLPAKDIFYVDKLKEYMSALETSSGRVRMAGLKALAKELKEDKIPMEIAALAKDLLQSHPNFPELGKNDNPKAVPMTLQYVTARTVLKNKFEGTKGDGGRSGK